jgi:hypothetical protein
VRRSASPRPQEATRPAAAKTRRTFSFAPQVSARATCSGAGGYSRKASIPGLAAGGSADNAGCVFASKHSKIGEAVGSDIALRRMPIAEQGSA